MSVGTAKAQLKCGHQQCARPHLIFINPTSRRDTKGSFDYWLKMPKCFYVKPSKRSIPRCKAMIGTSRALTLLTIYAAVPTCTGLTPPAPRPYRCDIKSLKPTGRLDETTMGRRGRGALAIILQSRPSDEQQSGDAHERERATKLLVSLLIDLVGFSSFAVPALGETTDLAWAPISCVLIQYLYGNALISGLGLVEELLPGFDFIPTATIAWFLYYGRNSKNGLSSPPTEPRSLRRTEKSNDTIDV